MKRMTSFLLCAGLMLASANSIAAEPTNLFLVKQGLKKYHDSGAYEKDLNNIDQAALSYLKKRVAQGNFGGKKPAIVLDIDETSLSNYQDMVALDFGGTIEEIRQDEDKGQDPAISGTLKLFQFAKSHQVAVFFVTGRFEEERSVTENNLKQAGYSGWDKLVLRDGNYRNAPASVYKSATRQSLTKQGYDIVLNMGDQLSDLKGGFADKTFKLPNPYYFIP